MKLLHQIGCISLTLSIPGIAFTPSSIEKTHYNTNNSSDPNYSASTWNYFDGLGREIRSVTEEGYGYVVSGIQYDDAGRPIRTLKPFYTTTHGHWWKAVSFTELTGEANAYFNGSSSERPNAGGSAFADAEFYEDPLTRAKINSSPGAAFNLSSGKTKRSWSFARATRVLSSFVTNPTVAMLDGMTGATNGKYTLEITKDEDDRYTQTLKDNFGRSIMVKTDPTSAANDEIITENVYSADGRLLKTLLPGAGGVPDLSMAITYTYSSSGLLLEETYPDEGKTEYRYDPAGRLRLKRDSRNAAESGYYAYMTYYRYDKQGRKIEEGVAEFPSSNLSYYFNADRLADPAFPSTVAMPRKRWYYDSYADFDLNLNVPWEVDLSSDPNGRGKLVASVAYAQNSQGLSANVMKFFRYDSEGRIAVKSIVIPEIPTQNFYYYYDIQGRVTNKVHVRYGTGGAPYTYCNYSYDAKGRMTQATQSGAQDITYSYEPTGKLKEKRVGSLLSDRRTYSVRDWPKTIDVQNMGARTNYLYSEAMTYETATSPSIPQFAGNISIATHRYYGSTGVDQIGHSYTYDGVNRLINTGFTTEFQEAITYDSKGRILTKRENGVTHGPYEYAPGTNRVTRIQNHPTRSNTLGNFFYDARGNLIYDRSKKMAIAYTYDNMPSQFIFYNTDPPEGAWLTHTDIRSATETLYDAENQRVLKRDITF